MANLHSTYVIKEYGLEWHKKKLCLKEKRSLNNFVFIALEWQIFKFNKLNFFC